MLRYYLYLLMVIVFFSVIVAANGESEDAKPAQTAKSNVQMLMRDKLTRMQSVLGALVTEDFDKIKEEAEFMGLVGKAASWQTLDTPRYKQLTERYLTLTSELHRAAQDKNRDGTMLQYLQLNISCVDCHQYMAEHQ